MESAKAYLQKAQDELGKVENVDEQINEVEQKISQITQELGLLAAKLSLERRSAAQKLENGVETGLQNLQMKDARFRVHLTLEPHPDGLDLAGQRVAFDAKGVDTLEVLIEHNQEIIREADWIIDLGPEGGEKGGEIIAEGTPEEIAQNPNSWTGKYLKRSL